MPGPGDELKDLGDTIDGLLDRLQAAFGAQRQFVANASHELRTPLTLTKTLLQMTLTDPRPTLASYRATCQDVLAAGEHQERLIEALLTLARSQRGLDHREPLDLAAITSSVLRSCEPDATARGLAISASITTAPVLGDARLLQRLAANLIDNAVRHNIPGGQVGIRVTAMGPAPAHGHQHRPGYPRRAGHPAAGALPAPARRPTRRSGGPRPWPAHRGGHRQGPSRHPHHHPRPPRRPHHRNQLPGTRRRNYPSQGWSARRSLTPTTNPAINRLPAPWQDASASGRRLATRLVGRRIDRKNQLRCRLVQVQRPAGATRRSRTKITSEPPIASGLGLRKDRAISGRIDRSVRLARASPTAREPTPNGSSAWAGHRRADHVS